MGHSVYNYHLLSKGMITGINWLLVCYLDFYNCKQKTSPGWQQSYFHAWIITLCVVCMRGPIHPLSALYIHTGKSRHHSCMTMTWPATIYLCYVYIYKMLNITCLVWNFVEIISIWCSWVSIESVTWKQIVFLIPTMSSTFQKIRISLSLNFVCCYQCDKDYHQCIDTFWCKANVNFIFCSNPVCWD